MHKIKWHTQTLTIPVGQTYDQKSITIPKGESVVAAAVASRTKDQIIDLGLKENGNTIETAMDLDFWKRSDGASFVDGFKPLEYKGNSDVTIELTAKSALTEAIQVQVVFGVIQNDSSCS